MTENVFHNILHDTTKPRKRGKGEHMRRSLHWLTPFLAGENSQPNDIAGQVISCDIQYRFEIKDHVLQVVNAQLPTGIIVYTEHDICNISYT